MKSTAFQNVILESSIYILETSVNLSKQYNIKHECKQYIFKYCKLFYALVVDMQHNQFFTHEDLYVVGTQKNGLNEIDSTRHALTDDKKVIGIVRLTFACLDMSHDMRLPTCGQQSLRSACPYAQSDQCLC